MKKRSTARLLLLSMVSLLISISMLVGTTFAWFTDLQTAVVSPVRAGSLAFAMEMSLDGTNWEITEGKTLDFVDPEGGTICWEPGTGYRLPLLRVRNVGNLAMKYYLKVGQAQPGQKLSEVLSWSVTYGGSTTGLTTEEYYLAPGAVSEVFTVSATMASDASMAYQGLSMEGISVAVYAAQDTAESDSFGNRYDEDAEYNKEVVSTEPAGAAKAAFPGMGSYMASQTSFTNVNFGYSAFTYQDLDMFENSTVDHINVYANQVSAVDDNQYMTVYVVDNETAAIQSTHKFYAKAESLESTAPKRIVSLYCPETVTVGQGQTLMFSANGDPLIWGYIPSDGSISAALKGFWDRSGFSGGSSNGILCIDVYTTAAPVPPAPSPEELELKAALSGKRLSILGDSISTYSGWSNSTATNSTLGGNAVYYPQSYLNNVDQTWWKQIVDTYGMELLVNNSWSGSSVTDQRTPPTSYGYNTRPGNLHQNVGGSAKPDVIAIYMGTNDLWDGVGCNPDALNEEFWAKIEAEGFVPASKANFEEACALMVYKVKRAYPNAEVFLFNNPTMSCGTEANRQNYNQIFQAIASHYGCHVVDLYGSSLSSYSAYTSDGVHPNARGMDIMTEVFAEKLRDVYVN